MKIQNKALAGVALGVGGKTIQGDAEGCFDVPEKNAKALLDTPGWSQPKSGKAPSAAPEPPAAPPEDDLTEEVNEAVDEVTKADEEPDDIDLDSMTKNELIDLAVDHGIDVDATMRKADIKEAIEAALGGN